MEEIFSTNVIELLKYGLLGVFTIIFIIGIIMLYKELKALHKEFTTYLQTTNDKLIEIVSKNAAALDNMTDAYNANTQLNKKVSDMIETRIEIMDMLKKCETEKH